MGYEGLEIIMFVVFGVLVVCILSLAWFARREQYEEEVYTMLDVV